MPLPLLSGDAARNPIVREEARRAARAGQRHEASRVATGSASRAGRTRSALHDAAGAVAWISLATLAFWQFSTNAPPRWALVVIGAVCFIPLLALLAEGWIWWNRSIYRRRHRRTNAIHREVSFDRDMLGRRLFIEPPVLDDPPVTIVTVDPGDEVKRYWVPGVPYGEAKVDASGAAAPEIGPLSATARPPTGVSGSTPDR
jgi:hypothetical protein